MTHVQGLKAAQQYGSMAVQTGIEAAGPHRLIQMLMEGALEKMIVAKAHLLQGHAAEKGENISWAISIIDGMRASLDMDAGGEIAGNLRDLYDYMERRLLEANIRNDAKVLDEVANLMRQIKAGWDSIPEAMRQAPSAG